MVAPSSYGAFLYGFVLGWIAWATPPAAAEDRFAVAGESLVLDQTRPGMLCFDALRPESVVVRSTYLPEQANTIVYERDRDYVLDAEHGSIARTVDSRIPDFSTNLLYGQRDFDHSQFPGFGNTAFFVFVDYETRNGAPLCAMRDQTEQLRATRAKLEAGGAFKLIVYGDSIAAGGDASTQALRFPQRYAAYLREKFPDAAITVENGATGGDTTRSGLMRLEDKVLTRNPDLVLVGFGMNDHNVNGVPIDEFKKNLTTITTRIHEETGADVLLFSTFPPNPEWKFGSHRMAAYAAATQEVAAATASAFADIYGPWTKLLTRKDPSSMLGNNINHPNDFGHGLYYEALKSIRF